MHYDDEQDATAQLAVATSPGVSFGAVLLVACGGAIGTALREAISLVVPVSASFPIAIFGINMLGALMLGFLLEALVRAGDDSGLRVRLRLLLGTGVLGGFTTYSALALDSALLADSGEWGIAVAYALSTVALGACCTLGGIVLANTLHRLSRTAS